MVKLEDLLRLVVDEGASDVHLTVGSPPQLRVDDILIPTKHSPLTSKEAKELAYSILTEAQQKEFEENRELDLSFGIEGLRRFRVNIFQQRGSVGAAFRLIPLDPGLLIRGKRGYRFNLAFIPFFLPFPHHVKDVGDDP